VDQAISLLNEGDSARLIAGGHSLLPMMKLRLASFETLIDINGLASELGYIRREGDEIRVGAMARHRELLESEELFALFPIFRDAEHVIADPVVRNRGTIVDRSARPIPQRTSPRSAPPGRQLRHSRRRRRARRDNGGVPPRSLRNRRRRRRDADRDPHSGAAGGSSAYQKVERRAGDWAVTSSGAAVWMSAARSPTRASVLRRWVPTPPAFRDLAVAARKGAFEELFAQAGALAAEACNPSRDLRGTVEYKRHLASELTRRALSTSVDRINGQGA